MVADGKWSRLRHEFKWLNRNLGAARDLDVVILALQTIEDRSPLTSAFYQEWQTRCTNSHRRLAAVLQSKRYLRMISDRSHWIDKGAWTRSDAKRSTAGQHFAKKLSRWHKMLRKKTSTFVKMDAHERHQLRFRGKKLRYAIEFFGELFPRRHRSRLRNVLLDLTKAQECLGKLASSFELADGNASLARAQISLSPKRVKWLERAGHRAFRRVAALKPFWL